MRALQENSAALLIDMQERLMPVMHDNEKTLATAVRFVQGLRVLDIPIVVMRQYPKGLGDLVPEVRQALGDYSPIDKTAFSAWGEPEAAKQIQALGRKNIFVFGVEAHVCVLQSVIDLIGAGYNVFLPEDCVSSRTLRDKETALRRAEKEGAFPTSCESALFELLQGAGAAQFKAISNLIK